MAPLIKEGCRFWGAPALRSSPDDYFLTCWETHFNNIRDFLPFCAEHQFEGIIMTSWSTCGQYGYRRKIGRQTLEIFPVRNVYPLSGFRPLLAAYADALTNKEFEPKSFMIQYAMERYGFNEDDATSLWGVLLANPDLVHREAQQLDGITSEVHSDVVKAQEIIHNLSPEKHQNEFNHIQLMVDTRANYLAFKRIEDLAQSDSFSSDDQLQAVAKLKEIMKINEELNAQFLHLNAGFLHDDELNEIGQIRSREALLLYDRLHKVTLA